MSNFAIIVAGGKGRRFGAEKQFYPFRGRPLLLYSVDAFESSPVVDNIIIVVPKSRIGYIKNLTKNYKKVKGIVAGGERRQDSVLNGLEKIASKNGIVAIQDAVRPMLSLKNIKLGFKYCQRYNAVVFGTPIIDTIKKVKKNRVVETVPRKALYLVQTPQFFEIKLLQEAYSRVNLEQEFTDDASILEFLGIPVYIFQGDKLNLKITNRSDLYFLEKIL